MISEQLPPLPEPFMELHREISPHVYAAWAEQMRAYAAAALAQEREACLDCIRPNATPMEIAAAIRARGHAQVADRLARHGIPMPGDDNGNPSF